MIVTQAVKEAFWAKKQAQWQRIKPSVVNDENGTPKVVGMALQLATYSRGTAFMLTLSTDDFYESIVFGQLPYVVRDTGTLGSALRHGAQIQSGHALGIRPLDKRVVDLSDDEIDQVLSLWANGQSALSLPFIPSVHRGDGQEHFKD